MEAQWPQEGAQEAEVQDPHPDLPPAKVDISFRVCLDLQAGQAT